MSENMQNVNTILDIDDILGMPVDAIADIPDYVTPETGLYRLSVHDALIKRAKEAGKAARIMVTITIEETLQLSEGSMPVADGSLFVMSYQGTQQGIEYFKRDAKKMLNAEELPTGLSIGDLFDALKSVDPFKAKVTTSTSAVNTKDPATGEVSSKTYTNTRVDPIFEDESM